MEEAPQLYLTLEALPGQATIARLQAALGAARVASVCLMPPSSGGPIDAKAAAPLVKLIQDAGAAALVRGDPALARSLGADGVHLDAAAGLQEAYVAAREALGTAVIVGVEISESRHDAMSLGEMGADYIAFRGPERDELARWWSEVFVVPCVALGVASPEDAEALAGAGVEFIGVDLPAASAVAGTEELVRKLAPGRVAGNAPRSAAS